MAYIVETYRTDTWERAFDLAREKESELPIQVIVTEPCTLCCREGRQQKRAHQIRLMGPHDEPVAFPLVAVQS